MKSTNNEIKRSIIDKIGSIIVFIGTIVLFAVEKFESYLTTNGFEEIAKIIPFVSALSLFCFIWSFIWDNKVLKLNKMEQNLKDEVRNDLKALNRSVQDILIKDDRIESKILFENEMHLNNFLSLQENSSDFVQINVITNSPSVENDNFGKAICQNIINNHQYVYVSPLEEKTFMDKLHSTLVNVSGSNIDRYLLETAFQKNIRHIQKQENFSFLPSYSDIVIYIKKKMINYDQNTEKIIGYFSFQNKATIIEGVECYYYNLMAEKRAEQIVEYIEKQLEKNPNLSIKNYISPSVEIKKSSIEGNGLFAKSEIKKGETIFIKGGAFVLKSELDNELKKKNQYIQINDDYVVSSIKFEENIDICFPINHSCRNPNCGFETSIKIVATKDIKKDDEILIDYAFFDPDYCKDFECETCAVGTCDRKTKKADEILKEFKHRKGIISPYLREKI